SGVGCWGVSGTGLCGAEQARGWHGQSAALLGSGREKDRQCRGLELIASEVGAGCSGRGVVVVLGDPC
uniref:Uncharacterized protein n=1 Tax=Athene cunicularia TaxID=194338 RepID=A0A663MVI2_ATHCN